MNTKKLLVIGGLWLGLMAPMAVSAHTDHGKSQYGGVVAEAGEAQFEIVSKDGKVTVYVTNHGEPVRTDGASGKLTILAGAAKSEIALKPSGENRLTGDGTIPKAAKLLISVQLPGGKTAQARAVAP